MKKLRPTALFTILFILIGTSLPGRGEAINGKLYSSREGELTGTMINSIMQDSHGYIWISTEDGLNKFDGYTFTQYRSIVNDTTALKDNYTRIVLEDSRKRLWINGMQIYDRQNDSFISIPFVENGRQRENPHVMTMLERKNGELWIGTALGLFCADVKEDRPVLQNATRRLTKNRELRINVLAEDQEGNVWVGTDEVGLLQYTTRGNTLHALTEGGELVNNISSICQDLQGNLYAGSLTDGVFLKEKGSRNFRKIIASDKHVYNITALMWDETGHRLLIGTDGDGLKSWNPDTGQMVDAHVKGAPIPMNSLKIHALTKDRQGNLWVGIYQKGVLMLPADRYHFDYLGPLVFDDRNRIGNCFIMSLYTDREDMLWVGTDNDGLYRVDLPGGRSRHWDREHFPRTVMDLQEDPKGRMWIATYHDGLVYLNPHDDQCHYYRPRQKITERISCLTLAQDKLWVGTYGSGVLVLDLETGRETCYNNRNSILGDNWINTIYTDRNGCVWIGCSYGLYTVQGGMLTDVSRGWGEDGYIMNSVNAIMQDREGRYWIGTRHGLYCKQYDKIIHLTTADGLPDDFVSWIEEDRDGNLWLSTKKGIACYNTRKHLFTCFSESDGLQGNEFAKTGSRDRQGNLYFGGINGITYFNPADIRKEASEQRSQPVVALTSISMPNGDRLPVRDVIELAYPENSISMELSTFDFTSPQSVSYQYRLDRGNRQWNDLPEGGNRLNLTGMAPGHYRIAVRAYANGLYSEPVSQMLYICPPWYLTGWAKTLWILVALAAVTAAVVYTRNELRQRQAMERMRQAKEMNESKLQFFINLSHEIRTPMTLIAAPLEQLLLEKSDKQRIYRMMYRNVQRVLQLVSQLMDIRKIDKQMMKMKFSETDLKGYVETLVRTFSYQAQKMNIDLQWSCQEGEVKAYIDRRYFDKIIVNLLGNAFKFTPQRGTITVWLRTVAAPEGKQVEIGVEDTGIGIRKEEIDRIFDRFYQAANPLNEKHFGTGIGLHLAKSLAELHHGSIHAEQRQDGPGSRFIVCIPAGSSHLRPDELDDCADCTELPFAADESLDLPSDTAADAGQPLTGEGTRRRKPRILVVDDDFEMRDYLRHELEDEFDIDEQNDGSPALVAVLKSKPDLVISDVRMNTMDGITLCKKIKSNLNVASTPVILFTAQADDRNKMMGLEHGADAYLEKPFNIGVLRSTIRGLINKRIREEKLRQAQKQQTEQLHPVSMDNPGEKFLKEVIDVINRNLDNPRLNVHMLAEEIGMNRIQLYRLMKEEAGQAPLDFIRNIRLKQAATLLEESESTVSEIAYRVGYSSISHFSSTFKQFYGMMPTEYRRQKKG